MGDAGDAGGEHRERLQRRYSPDQAGGQHPGGASSGQAGTCAPTPHRLARCQLTSSATADMLQEMNEKKQKELGRTSLKKYNKNPRMEIQKIENLNKPLALINQFCKDVGIKISIAAEGASARRTAAASCDKATSEPDPLTTRIRFRRRGGGRRSARDSWHGVDSYFQICY